MIAVEVAPARVARIAIPQVFCVSVETGLALGGAAGNSKIAKLRQVDGAGSVRKPVAEAA
jgi:hypothetical protein